MSKPIGKFIPQNPWNSLHYIVLSQSTPDTNQRLSPFLSFFAFAFYFFFTSANFFPQTLLSIFFHLSFWLFTPVLLLSSQPLLLQQQRPFFSLPFVYFFSPSGLIISLALSFHLFLLVFFFSLWSVPVGNFFSGQNRPVSEALFSFRFMAAPLDLHGLPRFRLCTLFARFYRNHARIVNSKRFFFFFEDLDISFFFITLLHLTWLSDVLQELWNRRISKDYYYFRSKVSCFLFSKKLIKKFIWIWLTLIFVYFWLNWKSFNNIYYIFVCC